MQIDKPRCNFKNCRYCFDGNCFSADKYKNCEIVRCKDCVSFQRNRGAVISPNGYCFYLHNTMNANDFCSYGERKGANEYEKI